MQKINIKLPDMTALKKRFNDFIIFLKKMPLWNKVAWSCIIVGVILVFVALILML